jgi:DNA repair protein NreA
MQTGGRCLFCKAESPRGFCGRPQCPYLARSQSMFRVAEKLPKGTNIAAQSPAPFIGRVGYPHVNVGVLAPIDPVGDVELYDHPRFWAKNEYSINKVVDMRSSLLNSRAVADVHSREKVLDVIREVGMAAKPVDLEINLVEKPTFSLNVNMTSAPHGPNAQLKSVDITSNPKIDKKVDRVVSDVDWKAGDALNYLYEHNYDENFLSRLLSVGDVGIQTNRKLVPTRWSITATDDILGKERIAKIKELNTTEHICFFGSYLGNYYLIMFFPDPWSYELFEAYLPKGSNYHTNPPNFATDYESFEGRKAYASETAGGYYAARLPILDKLVQMNAQASVLVLRFITDEYTIPLGVWVVREATRKAILSQPLYFGSRELMVKYAKIFVEKKFGVDAGIFFSKSILLQKISTQSKLSSW